VSGVDELDELAELVSEELVRQAAPHEVIENDEPHSWRVGDLGAAFLNGPATAPALVAQRRGGVQFPEPFDPLGTGEVERVVADVLRTLQ
jgi:hypothetical protein